MTTSNPGSTIQSSSELEDDTLRRVTRRLLPLVMVLFFVAYLDRANISVAALTMNDDIGLSASAFGVGAGLFYVTYILFEVPSNLALDRFGARRWIARIMVTWGVVSGAMAFVGGEASFYTVRLLLGAAEAGFTPGIVFYLALWFPARRRARPMALFYVGSAVANAVGAPLSGLIVKLDGLGGVAGWRWLFVIEAIPAVVLAVVVLRFMTDSPDEAGWLPERNRRWLTAAMESERRAVDQHRTFTVGQALLNPGMLLLALFLFLYSFNSIALTLWMPQVIQGSFGNPSDFVSTLLTAVPYALAAVLMLVVAKSVATRDHPHLHMAVPMASAAVLLLLSVVAGASFAGFVLLAVSTGVAWSAIPALWQTATSYMTGVAAAAGVALINALANFAGLGVTPLIGQIKDATGSFSVALLVVAAAMLVAAVVALAARPFTSPGRLAERIRSESVTERP